MNKIYFLFLLLLYGCKNYYLTPQNSPRPKHSHFKLAKAAGNVSPGTYDKIDTSSVYIGVHVYDDSVKVYSFYRFFSNGKAFYGFQDPLPPNDSCYNNLGYGSIGFYKVQGEQITIEMFGLTADGCQYTTYSGIIIGSDVKLTKAGTNILNRNALNDLYKKTPAHLTSKPDW